MSYKPSNGVKKFLKKILYNKRKTDLETYEAIAAIIDKNFLDWPEECEYLKQEISKMYGITRRRNNEFKTKNSNFLG
jgi:hypothetical protein